MSPQFLFSQEWKNIKDYQNATGLDTLQNGCWLKKDRTRNTETWKQANKYNLSVENGNLKYKSIKQIRDFYLWFDDAREKQGHEINAIGVSALVAGQFSYLDNSFIRIFIVRNKEVVLFGNKSATRVLKYAFPLLKDVYFSNSLLKGQKAKDWDNKYEKLEQCKILKPLYSQLSPQAIRKLERMARGKGIYNLGVKNKLKFEGDIRDCKSRYEHAFYKLTTYYLDLKAN